MPVNHGDIMLQDCCCRFKSRILLAGLRLMAPGFLGVYSLNLAGVCCAGVFLCMQLM